MTPIISWFRGMNSLVLWHRSCPFRAYSALNAYSAAGLEPGEPDIPSVLVTGVQAASSASAMSASAHPLRTHEVKGPPGQRAAAGSTAMRSMCVVRTNLCSGWRQSGHKNASQSGHIIPGESQGATWSISICTTQRSERWMYRSAGPNWRIQVNSSGYMYSHVYSMVYSPLNLGNRTKSFFLKTP